MKKRRQTITPRKPIFLGCEGESEQSYGQLLNDLLRAENRPVHIEVVNLSPGAGDPLSRLRRAAQEISRREQRRSEFVRRVTLLDSDQVDGDAGRRQEAERFAQRFRIGVIWQEPCHEAFLLRHLEGYAHHRPSTTRAADVALRAAWPEYGKPMSRLLLARRIGLAHVRRAAVVERALAAFLREIGLAS